MHLKLLMLISLVKTTRRIQNQYWTKGVNFKWRSEEKVGYCKGFLSKFFYVNSGRVSLDSKSELLVRQTVEHLMQNRTVLVISYRLETVMMAKRVFLLDDGKLKELPQSTMLDGQKDSLLSSGLVI
ncbi:hypothetical protein GLYMA_13G154466v4 [Glycine max]|nr:hypothetical protein GLYMA_13G154466v4 [Glycine max]KAH1101711.1 hypothetical protein GYH30_036332 [Glycine max]